MENGVTGGCETKREDKKEVKVEEKEKKNAPEGMQCKMRRGSM